MLTRSILLMFVIALANTTAPCQDAAIGQSRALPARDQYVSLAPLRGFNPFKRKTTSTAMTDEMVASAEQVLQAYHRRCEHKDDALRDSLQRLGNNRPSSTFAGVDLQRAYRQYACGVDKRDDVLLYVNGFCEVEHFPCWKSRWVFMNDGGPCFFQAVINVTSRTIEMLRVNGFA